MCLVVKDTETLERTWLWSQAHLGPSLTCLRTLVPISSLSKALSTQMYLSI